MRANLHTLALLSESVALLDMLCCGFARTARHRGGGRLAWVRPQFTEGSGPIAIDGGRHRAQKPQLAPSSAPCVRASAFSASRGRTNQAVRSLYSSHPSVYPPALSASCPSVVFAALREALEDPSAAPFVPNSLFLSEFRTLLVVSGPNMSGKTTYLKQARRHAAETGAARRRARPLLRAPVSAHPRSLCSRSLPTRRRVPRPPPQVAVLAVLAHAGSFVPANFASFRVLDRIFTRRGSAPTPLPRPPPPGQPPTHKMAHCNRKTLGDSLLSRPSRQRPQIPSTSVIPPPKGP